MRFSISSSSTTNGCSIEIFSNVVSGNGFGMDRITGTSTTIEGSMLPGTYYIRVVSTNTFNTYDPTGIPTYTLSVLPVSRVDEIEILNYNTSDSVEYNEGYHHRVQHVSGITNQIGIRARAIYRDPSNLTHPSANVRMTAVVTNIDWAKINRPDMAITTNNSVTNSNGIFGMYVQLKSGLGARHYPAIVSVHYYDYKQVHLFMTDDSSKYTDDNLSFFHFHIK